MFDLLLKNINRHVQLTAAEANHVTSFIKSKKLRRKQYLLQAGDVCRYEYFVTRGCLRSYMLDEEGQEHVLQFGLEEWWIGDLYSFLTETPATYNIDALEESEVLMIDKQSIERLYLEIPKFERFFRIIIQNAYISLQRRITENLSLSAEDRYISFLQRYPSFEQRLPQHQVASYLGITPESLSRIRKQMAEKS